MTEPTSAADDLDVYADADIPIPAIDYRARTQTFFANIAASLRAPAYGARDKDMMSALLIQAQAAGLYTP